MIRSIVFMALFAPLVIAVAAIGGTVSYFTRGPGFMRWMLKRLCKTTLFLTRWVLNVKLEIRGLERWKDGARPMLIVPKHQSELDVFPPLAMHPDLSAIAMAELTNYPFFGPPIRKLDYILVSVTGKKRNQSAQVVEGAMRAHAQGRPILIYPEGELMRIGSRERYRSGVWHIYNALGIEATPVACSTGLAWPQRKFRKRPGQRCVMEFMEPIPPGLDKETFMAELERRIETRCMELIEEHGSPEDVAVARERHRRGLTNSDDKTAAGSAVPIDA
ncbi:MAG: lysophospholipid acyltransferase family protein [Pseudomonadota bacterium]